MEKDLEQLQQWMAGQSDVGASMELGQTGDRPSMEQLDRLIRCYPYFAAPVAAKLRLFGPELTGSERNQLKTRLALLEADADKVEIAIFGDVGDFYPDNQQRKSPDTDNAIDTFFARFGKSDPAEDALLERLIFNPVPDYAELLEREEGNDPAVGHIDGIPDFNPAFETIVPANSAAGSLPDSQSRAETCNTETDELRAEAARAETDEHNTEAADAESDKPKPLSDTTAREAEYAKPQARRDDSLLSESLAKMFIKQGRYQRAYEIISNLNLNYPEKSVYFADQLRFLRKLIILQKHQSHTGSASEN